MEQVINVLVDSGTLDCLCLLAIRLLNKQLCQIVTVRLVRSIICHTEPWKSHDRTRVKHPRTGGYDVVEWFRIGQEFVQNASYVYYVADVPMKFDSWENSMIPQSVNMPEMYVHSTEVVAEQYTCAYLNMLKSLSIEEQKAQLYYALASFSFQTEAVFNQNLNSKKKLFIRYFEIADCQCLVDMDLHECLLKHLINRPKFSRGDPTPSETQFLLLSIRCLNGFPMCHFPVCKQCYTTYLTQYCPIFAQKILQFNQQYGQYYLTLTAT